MFIRYLQLCKSDIIYVIIGLISGGIASYFGVYVSEHTSRIMQGDFSNERLLLLLKASIITIMTTSLRGSLFTYSQNRMKHRIKCIIYEKLLNQPSEYYQITPVISLLELITNDVRLVSNVISLNINVISRSVICIIITCWLLINISWKLTIVAIIIIPFNFLISKIYDKMHSKLMLGFEDANKLHNSFIHETISHVSLIKTFATEELSRKKHDILSKNISKYYEYESIMYAINLFIVYNMPIITTITVIISAKYMLISDGLITFVLHNQGLYGTIQSILNLKNEFSNCRESYKRIIDILDTPSLQKGYYIPSNDIIGTIQFKNIYFKYQNATENILTNFSFNIKQGDKIAIIGPSGSGKSTIVKLLIGIINPLSGSILIDDVDTKHYDNEWLKKRIGYVAQDSIMFSDTIANNIAYGLETYTDDDIVTASKLANAHEFILKLPNQYQTKLEGTELSSLSGGQKQRISIARALVRKPQIIIFDEATSALDPYCEETVQNTIKECFTKQQSTMIIIAHRRSALDIADKIYNLDNSQLLSHI